MLKFLFASATLLLSISAHAQYKVSGVVRDAETREPLVNATVGLSETQRFQLSDARGQFSFEEVAAGRFTLRVSYVGYESAEQAVEVRSNVNTEILLRSSAIITDEVVVRATRATGKTPTTFTNVTRGEIEEHNFGQDGPFLLHWTPSVVTTSDAGTGIGYTGIRIRGSDPTRINVTINGIPYNDSESLGTFWVDIPDIASSAESIQIQRGVGTSTNGAGSFVWCHRQSADQHAA
jgi:iron complex outermembrane recepter protein